MIRTFVLVEPYGPLNVAIFTKDREADAYTATLRAQQQDYRLITSTGTVHDLRAHQRELRAAYLKRIAEQVQTAASAS